MTQFSNFHIQISENALSDRAASSRMPNFVAQLIWVDQAPGRFLVLGLEMKLNPSWISLDRDFEL